MIAGTAPLVEVVMEEVVEVGEITTMVTGGTVVAPVGAALRTMIDGERMDRLSGLSSNFSQGQNHVMTKLQHVVLTLAEVGA